MQRFSEAQFRQYEPLIEAAVYVLPARYEINVPWNGLAQSTVSRNLREAIQALHANPKWDTTVNRVKYNQYFSALEVAEVPGQVLVRLRTRGQRTDPSTAVQCANSITFARGVDPSVVSTLIDWIHTGLITGGITVHNCGISQENVSVLAEQTNVAVLTQHDAIVLL